MCRDRLMDATGYSDMTTAGQDEGTVQNGWTDNSQERPHEQQQQQQQQQVHSVRISYWTVCLYYILCVKLQDTLLTKLC